MFTKPKTYRRVKELQLWDVGLLVVFAIFVVLLLWCRWIEKAGQTHPKICILFSIIHDTSLLIYGIQATWGGCNVVLPYHMVCFISYCFKFSCLVIVILAFLHLHFTIKVSLCVITKCFGTRLQWIKHNLDLPWSIKISKF